MDTQEVGNKYFAVAPGRTRASLRRRHQAARRKAKSVERERRGLDPYLSKEANQVPAGTASARLAAFFCSNSLHQPLISVSLKILPMTRRRRPFRFGFSTSRNDRMASSL